MRSRLVLLLAIAVAAVGVVLAVARVASRPAGPPVARISGVQPGLLPRRLRSRGAACLPAVRDFREGIRQAAEYPRVLQRLAAAGRRIVCRYGPPARRR